MSNRVLYHTVMARIANPDSKRASVRCLERDFGVHVPLEKVYRMMDRLDDAAIAGMRARIGAYTRSLFPEPIDLFDCTTLFFESSCEDTLRAYGYSKDGKHGEVQVLLAVTHGGLPLRGLSRQQLGGGQLHPNVGHDASGDSSDRRRRGHVQQE